MLPYSSNVNYGDNQPTYFVSQRVADSSSSQDVDAREFAHIHGFPSPQPYDLPVVEANASRNVSKSTPPSSSQGGKGRREKARIELAADQPLTTQGKLRMRVYVACVQCRSRKIRCDGAKPICHNCSRRTDSDGRCSYDTAPKRRGPDRYPGARQRMSGGGGNTDKPRRRTRRREPSGDPCAGAASGSTHDVDETSQSHSTFSLGEGQESQAGGLTFIQENFAAHSKRDFEPPPHDFSVHHPFPPAASLNSSAVVARHRDDAGVPYSPARPAFQYGAIIGSNSHASQVISPYTAKADDEPHDVKPTIAPEPSLQFTRETWWDALLSMYSIPIDEPRGHLPHLTPAVRDATSQRIISDLHWFFRSSMYWFSFINLPRFFGRILDPNSRRTLQPSLILSVAALATFLRSSESVGMDATLMRERALRLRDEAQSALEASVSARWIDKTLIQASWMIAFFEISAHPLHSTERVQSSIRMLDSLIQVLDFTHLDGGDPRVCTWSPRAGSLAARRLQTHPQSRVVGTATYSSDASHALQAPATCSCHAYTLGHNWPRTSELAPLWTMTPAWPKEGPEGELTKEECRRLVWSTVALVAGHSNYTSVNPEIPPLNLYVMNADNYALLLPGESLVPVNDAHTTHALFKESVWALYMRTMQLWHTCVRMRGDASMSDADKAQFAVATWLELDGIEEALGRHNCSVERAFLFQGREYIFNTRMCISYEYQRYIPQVTANANVIFHRKHAEDWLKHQAVVAKRAISGLHMVTDYKTRILTKRPLFLFWFMSQISRSLTLWRCDQTLTLALDVAIMLLAPVNYLMTVWPCPEQRRRYHTLHSRLVDACRVAGLPPPVPTV
ncbi:hypothetical protein OBBRIDRAFT_858538 [Obba rivulosa]|uniref:Zn(2)-C6 fungal-type domain-containing protein n=1 Tax=Obba rivulosa TaxID=1052685 RepID=A0A8E2ARX4_9APHY|nr:hypothetical protein OBBRIDRAFT_858538 [Obba rivulosa]